MNQIDVEPLSEMTKLNNELISLYRELNKKNAELTNLTTKYEKLLSEINILKGLIPVCMYCRKIKDESNKWMDLEQYVRKNTQSSVSHGICDECYQIHINKVENYLDQDDK